MSGANEQMIQYWNEVGGPRWVSLQEQLDEELQPIGRYAMDRLDVSPGARVLDVGCGCGATTFELARRVGPRGKAFGIDVSAPMLAHARRRLAAERLSNVELALADAQVADVGVFDRVFSRFGVMFFEDPVVAFANLRRALAPEGRIGFVCWRSVEENPLMSVATRAASRHLELPPPSPPGAPGPFSFADGERPRDVLARAGFGEVEVRAADVAIDLARDVDSVARFFAQMGPAGSALRGAAPELVDRVVASLRELLGPFVNAGGVRLHAAVWLVTASR